MEKNKVEGYKPVSIQGFLGHLIQNQLPHSEAFPHNPPLSECGAPP